MALIASLDEGWLTKVVRAIVAEIVSPGHDHPTVEPMAEAICRELLRHQWPQGGWPCDFKPHASVYNPNCQYNDNAMLSAMQSMALLLPVMPVVDRNLVDDVERSLVSAWDFVLRTINEARQPGLPPCVTPLRKAAPFRRFEPVHVLDMHATASMVRHAEVIAGNDLMPAEVHGIAREIARRSGGLVRASAKADLSNIPGTGAYPRYLVDRPDNVREAWWIGDDKYAKTYAWRGDWSID